MKKCMSLFLCLTMLIGLYVPVRADDFEGENWIELPIHVKAEDGTAVRMGEASLALMEETNGEWDEVQWCWVESSETAADTWVAHINTAELQSNRSYYAVLYADIDTNVLSDGYLYCGENAEEAVAFYYSDENGSGQPVRIGSTAALTFVVETGWVITGAVNAPNGYIERRAGEGFPYPSVEAIKKVTEDGDGNSYYWGYIAINSRTAPWTYSIVVPKTVANYTIQRENNSWINSDDDYETNILFGGNAEYGSIPVTGNTTGPDITLGLLGATVSGTITAPTGADWWDFYDLEAQMSNGESYWGWYFDQSGESAVQYKIALPASPDGVTYTLYVEYSDSGVYRSGWLTGKAGSYTLTEDESAATRFSVANAAISFALPELERTEYSGRLLMEDGNAALPAGTEVTVDLFCYRNAVTGGNGGTSTGGATPSPAPASGGSAAPSPAPVSGGGGGGSSASSSAAASSGGAVGSPATTVSVGDFETETISVSAEVPSVQHVTASSSSLTVYSRDAVVGEDGRWSASFVNQSNGPKKLRITVPAVPNSGVRPGDYWYTGSMTASEDEGEAAWLPADTGGLDVYCEAGIGLAGTITAPESAADRRWGANLWAEMDIGERYYAGTSRETRSLTYNIGLPLSESDGTYRLHMNYWYYDGDDERVDSDGYLKLNNGDAQLVRNADDATVFSAADNAPSFQLPDIRKVEVTVRLVSQDASDTVEMPNGRLSLIKQYDKGYDNLADAALRPNGDGTWSATFASNYISSDDTYCLIVFPGDDSNVVQDNYYYCGEDATAPESGYGINTRIDDGVVNKIVVETGWVITGSIYMPESGYLNLNYPDENYYPGLSVYAETVDGDSRSYYAYAERASGEEGWSYRITVPKETGTYRVRTDANSGWWINRDYKTNVAFGASAKSEEFTVSGSGQAPDVTLPLVGPTVTGTITYPSNTSSLRYPYLYAVIGDERYEVMVENGSDWLTKQYSITFPLSEEEGKYRLFVSGTFVADGTRNNLDGWLKETDGDYTLVKDENKATWFNVADGAPSFEMPKEQKTKLYLSLVSTDGSEVSIPSGSIVVSSENGGWSSDLERDSDGKWYVQIPSAEISEEEQYRICFWTGDESNVVQNEYYYAGTDAEAAVTNRSDAALTTLTDGATYTIPVETGWVFTGRVVVPEGGYIDYPNAYGQYPAPRVMVDTTSDHYLGEVEVDSESGPWDYRLVLPKEEATYRLSMNAQYADNYDTNIYFTTQEDVLFTAGATASVPDITLDLIGATVTGTISANFSARDFKVYNVYAETTEGHTYGSYCDVTGDSLTYQIILPVSEVGKSYRLRIHCGYFDEITQNWHDMNGWLEKAGGKDYVTAQGGTVFTVQDSMIDAKIEKLVSADSNWDDVFSAVRSGTEIEKIFYNLQDSAVAVAVAYDEQGRMLESRNTLLTSADGNAVVRFRFTNAAAATKLSFYLVREGSWIPTDERQTMQY